MWPDRTDGWTDGFMQGPPLALQMLPAWVSLGNYNNILYARNLMQCRSPAPDGWKEAERLDLVWPEFDTPRRRALLEQPNSNIVLCSQNAAEETFTPASNEDELDNAEMEQLRSGDDPMILYSEASGSSYGKAAHLNAGLMLALPRDTDGDLDRRILSKVFALRDDADGLTPAQYEVLPQSEGASSTLSSHSAFFHVDAAGNACFSAEEARRASRRVIEMDLVERVKVTLNQTEFVLPQEQVDKSTFFCNESVYGKAKVLMVTGLVCLEKS